MRIGRQVTLSIVLICLAGAAVLANGWQTECSTLAAPVRNEDEILAELVALRLQIQSAQSERISLEEQLQDSLEQKDAQEQALEQIRLDLTDSSTDLGKWVAFTYRNGYVGILEVVLSATDFNDFLSRSFLLWKIIDRETHALEHNRQLRNRAEESLRKVSDLTETITKDKLELENTIAEMKQKEAELTQYLADLRAQSASLGDKLDALSQQWVEVTRFTTGIIDRLSRLPTADMPPDSVWPTVGGFRLVYRDATINRAVKKVNPDPSAEAAVHIEPQFISMSGRTDEINFDVRGLFEIGPDRKKIIFVPNSLTVNDTTMEGKMLDTILADTDLTWDIARYYPTQKVMSITNGTGKMTVKISY